MSPPRWPRRLLIAGAAYGVGILVLGLVATKGAVKGMALASPAVLLHAASFTSVLLLVGAGIARWKGGTSLGESRVPRLVVGIAGAALAAIMAMIVAAGLRDPELIAAGVGGLCAVAVAAVGSSRPWPAWAALVALACVVVFFEVPRETGHLGSNVQMSRSQSRTEYTGRDSCTSVNGGRPPSFRGFAHAYVLALHLGGNVGDLLPKPAHTPRRGFGLAHIEAHGRVDVPWALCFVPFYKPVSLSTTIEIRGVVEQPGGHCRATTTMNVELELWVYGIQSCRRTREHVGELIAGHIDRAAQGMISD